MQIFLLKIIYLIPAIETTINILKNNLTDEKKTDLINESIKDLTIL